MHFVDQSPTKNAWNTVFTTAILETAVEGESLYVKSLYVKWLSIE
jgi:hypothetical protein